MPNLFKCSTTDNTDSIVADLQRLTANIGDGAAHTGLCYAVKRHTESNLDVGNIGLSPSAATLLADAVKKNRAIKTLDVRGNDFSGQFTQNLEHELSEVNVISR